MSGMKTAYDSPEHMANRKLCETTNGELKKQGIIKWITKYLLYADPSRSLNTDGTISVWGNNITDVLCFMLRKDGTKAPCFIVGGDNLNDPSVLIDMSLLDAVIDDLEGGNARMVEPDGTRVTVAYILKNLGKLFKHLGIAEDTNMLGNFKNCTLRFQVHIVELEVGETLEDLEEGQLLMTASNYQSREDQAKNLNMLFTTQGVSITTDASAPGIPVPLYLQGQSEDDDKLHNYAIGVEATKRMFSQTGKQSMEEKLEQVARGRGAEMKLGPNHPDMPEMCAVMHMQVPLKNKPMVGGIDPNLLIAAAMAQPAYTSLSAPPPAQPVIAAWLDDEEAVDVSDGLHYCSMKATPVAVPDDDDEPIEVPTWRGSGDAAPINRSLSAAPPGDSGERYRGGLGRPRSGVSPAKKKARPQPPPTETCRAASTHKGQDMGVAGPINQKNLAPQDDGTAGIPTVTFSIFMVKPKGVAFGTQDVKNAIELAEKVRKCAGDVHTREHQKMQDAGATSTSLDVSSAVAIAETIKALHKPKKSNVPVGVPVY